jgi:hypothetical protein
MSCDPILWIALAICGGLSARIQAFLICLAPETIS